MKISSTVANKTTFEYNKMFDLRHQHFAVKYNLQFCFNVSANIAKVEMD